METENILNSAGSEDQPELKQKVAKILKNEKTREMKRVKAVLPNIKRVRDRDPKGRIQTR